MENPHIAFFLNFKIPSSMVKFLLLPLKIACFNTEGTTLLKGGGNGRNTKTDDFTSHNHVGLPTIKPVYIVLSLRDTPALNTCTFSPQQSKWRTEALA